MAIEGVDPRRIGRELAGAAVTVDPGLPAPVRAGVGELVRRPLGPGTGPRIHVGPTPPRTRPRRAAAVDAQQQRRGRRAAGIRRLAARDPADPHGRADGGADRPVRAGLGAGRAAEHPRLPGPARLPHLEPAAHGTGRRHPRRRPRDRRDRCGDRGRAPPPAGAHRRGGPHRAPGARVRRGRRARGAGRLPGPGTVRERRPRSWPRPWVRHAGWSTRCRSRPPRPDSWAPDSSAR